MYRWLYSGFPFISHCFHCTDLAIGSFLSGHAIVIQSRPVATLVGSITASPSSITLQEKAFEMNACIQYGGHRVPEQIGECTHTHNVWVINKAYDFVYLRMERNISKAINFSYI